MISTTSLINDCIFDFIYGMAMDDATRRTKCATSQKALLNKTDCWKAKRARQLVKGYANRVVSKRKPCDFYKTAREVENSLNTINRCFSFGNTQKLINMTMKYIYIANYFDLDLGSCYIDNDAPMDDCMRDFVYRSWFHLGLDKSFCKKPGFYISHPWSTLNSIKGKNEYKAFQIAINEIIKAKKITRNGKSINRIEFDYLFWDKARRLIGKSMKEQKTITRDIWETFDSKNQH